MIRTCKVYRPVCIGRGPCSRPSAGRVRALRVELGREEGLPQCVNLVCFATCMCVCELVDTIGKKRTFGRSEGVELAAL